MSDTLVMIGMLVLKGVVLPLVGLAVTWASAHLPALISTHVRNAKLAGILGRLGTLSFSVVSEVEQTFISSLGESPTADQLRAARDQAIAALKSHLGDKGLKEIEDVLGLQDQDAVVRLLVTFIETAVHNMKRN